MRSANYSLQIAEGGVKSLCLLHDFRVGIFARSIIVDPMWSVLEMSLALSAPMSMLCCGCGVGEMGSFLKR